GEWRGPAEPLPQPPGERGGRGVASAKSQLQARGEVARILLPQIEPGRRTGEGATGKILPAGLRAARAIVNRDGGREVRFGFKGLIQRSKGGGQGGPRVAATTDERTQPRVTRHRSS